MVKKHEVNEAAGITPQVAAALDAAAEEMENDVVFDESAMGAFDQPDVGRSTMHGNTPARNEGPTTSPKITLHDNLWTRLKNAHPYADSSDIEHMMTLVYQGQSVGEASRDGFASYDPDMVEHLLSLKEEEVLDLTGKLVVDDSLEDDYAEEEDEEGADEA